MQFLSPIFIVLVTTFLILNLTKCAVRKRISKGYFYKTVSDEI